MIEERTKDDWVSRRQNMAIDITFKFLMMLVIREESKRNIVPQAGIAEKKTCWNRWDLDTNLLVISCG